MNTNIFNEYPFARERMNQLRESRIHDLLDYLRHHDETYKRMTANRTETSMVVREILEKNNKEDAFEKYSDAIYAIAGHEREQIYEQGFADALLMVKEKNV